ncbi:helix-turn-helix domain-containing protein [Streptomyces sp. NPDC002078]
MVEQLRRQEPAFSARKIAARLGVGKDTIRRDIDEIRQGQSQRAPEQPATEPDTGQLVLVLDEPLRQALAALRAAPHVTTETGSWLA